MRRDVYAEVVQQLSLPVGQHPHAGQLLEQYGSQGLTLDGLISIFSQENQYKVIKRNHLVKGRIQAYTNRYLDGEDILALSIEADFPPCMLMRRILEHLLPGSKQAVGEVMKQPSRLQALLARPQCTCAAAGQAGPSMQQHCSITRCAACAACPGSQPFGGLGRGSQQCPHALQAIPPPQQELQQQQQQHHHHQPLQGQGQQDSLQVQDVAAQVKVGTGSSCLAERGVASTEPAGAALQQQQQQPQQQVPQQQCVVVRLQRDVGRCALLDCCYSPLCDSARQAAGLEFELLLVDKLRAAGVDWFWTEAQLRAQGYFKTPDVRLQVPIAVRPGHAASSCKAADGSCPEAGANGGAAGWRVVCWIDSKATFGDDRMHTKQLEEQYTTYVNRYGPGLVIYWFGCLDDLDTHPDVLLMDHFPEEHELGVLPLAPLHSNGAAIA